MRRVARVLRSAGLALVALSAAGSALAQQFERHVVVAQEAHAADVGAAVLDEGGNAVDAAVATAFALAVTLPEAGNVGGGGFAVVYLAEPREVISLDFRERAPAAATERMYLDESGRPLPGHRLGPRAAGVPGTVRGLETLHRRHGKLPWKRLVEPAVALARDGFPVSEGLARNLNLQLRPVDEPTNPPTANRLAAFPASVRAFAQPDGRPWRAGDRLTQPDLGMTLARIQRDGPDEFYRGKTADLLTRYMADDGGLITKDDLAAYEAKWREPLHGSYRGHDVYGMGPPSSGGVALILMLNLLEPHDLAAKGRESDETLHLVTEAMRRAFYTRARELADPDFVDIPTSRLIGKDYAAELGRSIGERATPSQSLADFPIVDRAESPQTTHFSVVDGDGNAVALTYTLEDSYGSKAVVPGAGFLLNNEMGDFNVIPGPTDRLGRIGTAPNRIAPGKRMLSSQSPTIVLKDGRLRLVTGSPGGRTIPNTVLWVVLNTIDFGLAPRAAVDAGRTHHAWFPDVVAAEGDLWTARTIDRLRERGHVVTTDWRQGDAHSIGIDPATRRIEAAPDRRRKDSKASGR